MKKTGSGSGFILDRAVSATKLPRISSERLAEKKEWMCRPPSVEEKSNLGDGLSQAMHLAGRYAYAGREIVARHVARGILRANIVEEVHNHHNFAWREKHNGDEFWVSQRRDASVSRSEKFRWRQHGGRRSDH